MKNIHALKIANIRMSNIRISRTIHKNRNTIPQTKAILSRTARLSRMAYLPEENIRNKLETEGAKKIFIYSYEGMLAFMAEFTSDVVVSFRGVGTVGEFKTILQFWKKEYKGVRVHAGFADSVDKFSKYIINDINTVPKGKKIIYTGHSFGGAMALLLTMHCKPDIICTFGAPRAGGGDNYLSMFSDVEVLRVQTKSDFVSMLPPSLPLIINYEHVGKPILLEGIQHPYEAHRMNVYLKNVIRSERYERRR